MQLYRSAVNLSITQPPKILRRRRPSQEEHFRRLLSTRILSQSMKGMPRLAPLLKLGLPRILVSIDLRTAKLRHDGIVVVSILNHTPSSH